MSKVVVVNEKDEAVGSAEISEAVKRGLIRRISRVILYNDQRKILLQQRGRNKVSNPLCWDVSAVGHVDEGESYEDAAYRELKEELGISNIKLEKVDYFFISDKESREKLAKFNTVFIGKYLNGKITINAREVEKVEWLGIEEIEAMFNNNPLEFTSSFSITLKRLREKLINL